MTSVTKLRIGVSSCLLGETVRYNGGHLRDAFLSLTLANYAEWVPVCPEVEVGMSIPREAVQLVGSASGPKMLGVRSRIDHSDSMNAWAAARATELSNADLHGYVFTKDSPSCGLFRVKIYPEQGGAAERTGRGVFAQALTRALPLLPVEENGRLNDPRLRENFIERLFVYARWKDLLEQPRSPRRLVEFHSEHKLAMMSHAPDLYREAGRIVARAGSDQWEELTAEYGRVLMNAMARLATPRKHANALQHAVGFLKRDLDNDDKAELLDTIEQYRLEALPLIVPITLLRHHLRKAGGPAWLASQSYLAPYPSELMLRNHV